MNQLKHLKTLSLRAALTLLMMVLTSASAWAEDIKKDSVITYDSLQVRIISTYTPKTIYNGYHPYPTGTVITMAPPYEGFTFHRIRITRLSTGQDLTADLLDAVTYDVPGNVSFHMPAVNIGIEVELNPPGGNFGNNNALSWALSDDDDDGIFETLNISGTGEMDNNCPWATYKNIIGAVNIGDGVTSIGNQAFSGCQKLTSVTIPASVTSIGVEAFKGCSRLRKVVVQHYHSPGITLLGANAFSGCNALSWIYVPNADACTDYKEANNWSQYEDKIQAINDEGAPANPYIISDKEQLDQLATSVNGGNDYAGKYFQLGADIAYDGNTNFTPIGTNDHPFKGTFRGNGHTITGTNVNSPNLRFAGLFGVISDATLDGIVVSVDSIRADSCCAVLVGEVRGTSVITNCTASGIVIANQKNVGGLVGSCVGDSDSDTVTIRNSIATVEVIAGEYTGGFIGYINGSAGIYNCRADGYASGAGSVGGFVGCIKGTGNVRVSKCAARVDVRSSANNYGGFIGWGYDPYTTISDCWCSGAVWGRGGNIGGFVGYSQRGVFPNSSFYPYGPGPRYLSGCQVNMFNKVLTASQLVNRSRDKNGTPWSAVKKHTYGLTPISTAAELRAVANDLAGCYVLISDIDLNGEIFEPIGNGLAPFTGEFYGQGHLISGVAVNPPLLTNKNGDPLNQYVGLFGNIAGGRVNGVRAIGCVTCNYDAPHTAVGGFAGIIQSKSMVDECSFDGEVSARCSNAGGFVGRTDDSPIILRCCVPYALVNSHSPSTRPSNAGGFVGNLGYGYIMDVYAITEVTTVGRTDVGEGNVGGFAGYVGPAARIVHAWCESSVQSQELTYVGAFVGRVIDDGYGIGIINNTYSHCNLIADSYYNKDRGGEEMKAAGTSAKDVSTDVVGDPSLGNSITGLTSDEMKQQSNFLGFDFDVTWVMSEYVVGPAFPWHIVDDHDVKMNDSGIMTYASDKNLDFSHIDGLTAYIVSAFDGTAGTLTLTPVGAVPAGTGLLLKGTAGRYFGLPVVAGASAPVQNYLVGVLDDATEVPVATSTHTNFILANGSSGINWYTLENDGAIGANKAYLSLPTGELNLTSGAPSFTWVYGDGSTTTIENGEWRIENSTDAWYALDGRRLSGKPTQRGIYINNGKKIVIK